MKNTGTENQLLYEIGVEEIPSAYFEDAMRSIAAKAPSLLSECGWSAHRLSVYATPRRLVVHVAGFNKLPVVWEEKVGPLKAQSYENGRPTKALMGFLKSCGRTESEVYFKQVPRGECVCVKIPPQKKPLSYFFETLPKGIEFPKLMRWDESRYQFTRPIRSAVAFVGSKCQKFRIGNIASGDCTFGHRFLSPIKLKLKNADFASYEKLLAKHHVILKTEDRIKKIKAVLRKYNNQNESLVHTVAYLTEEPYPVVGTFPESYLKLPSSVLETSMSKHQKIFSCYSKSGTLVNRFVAFVDGKRPHPSVIAEHYGRVLCSRLEDAGFFFQEDTKTKLETKVDKLKDVIFLGTLGSYYEKTERITQMAEFLSNETGGDLKNREEVKRSAWLSKADLVTHLVYEFPELQGIAGSEYAKFDGEKPTVCRGIRDHYLPKNLMQDSKQLKHEMSLEGALIGICDRVDLLTGAFGSGVEVSGSQDPYALRRAAGSIVKILRAYPIHFSLSKLIDKSLETYGKKLSVAQCDVQTRLMSFLSERIFTELQVKSGTRCYEILQAVLMTGYDDVADVYQRFGQLTSISETEAFLRACKVIERTSRILKGASDGMTVDIDHSHFEVPLEHEMFQRIQQAEQDLDQLINGRKYAEAAQMYGNVFHDLVDHFFDQVKVNSEKDAVRRNRRALVHRLNRLFTSRIADLSCVTNLSSI